MAEPDMVFGQLNYELSKRSHDGTVTEISIVEEDPISVCKCVSVPSLKIHSPSQERKSL